MWYLFGFFGDHPAICQRICYSRFDSIDRKFISSQPGHFRERLSSFFFSDVWSVRLISAISNLPVAIQHFIRYNVRKHEVPLYDPGELCSLRRLDNRNWWYDFAQLAASVALRRATSPWIKNRVRETFPLSATFTEDRVADLLEDCD